ncbi:hypothetical protein SALBM135S_03663 [Streptomyces alboniger]
MPALWPNTSGTTVLDGERIEIGGRVFGFVGGGLRTPMRTPYEISDEEYAAKIEAVGEVDVLCTHIPPDVPELLYHVARRFERGSRALLEAIRRTRPRYALFGHVHQPLVRRMRVGATECVNVGHFAGSGRPWAWSGERGARGSLHAVDTTSDTPLYRTASGGATAMAEHTSSSITMEADAGRGHGGDRRLRAVPGLDGRGEGGRGPGYRDEQGRAKEVRLVMDAGAIKDDQTLGYTWTGDDEVSWTLVKSQMLRSLDGSYHLKPAGSGTQVTYRLTVDVKIPMLGMIKRKAEAIIDLPSRAPRSAWSPAPPEAARPDPARPRAARRAGLTPGLTSRSAAWP